MRNKWISLCLALGAVIGASGPSARAQSGHTIAVINRERLYMDYYRTKRAQRKLVERLHLYRKEYNDQRGKIQELEKTVKAARTDALNPDLSVSERDARRAFAEEQMLVLTRERNDLQERTKVRNDELNSQAGRMRERILDKLDREIASYAERKGFLLVFSRSPHPNVPDALAYVAPVLDITEQILELLNADAPAPDEEIDDDMGDLFGDESALTNAADEAFDSSTAPADEKKAEQ